MRFTTGLFIRYLLEKTFCYDKQEESFHLMKRKKIKIFKKSYRIL